MGEAWGESADLLSLLVIITAIHFLSSPFYIAIEALGSIGPKLAIQMGFVVLLLAGVIIVRPSTAERLLGMWLLVELLRTSIGLLVFSLITRDGRKPRNHVDNCS
jgi:O-antigen/teichoic acid export membrane protein